MKHLRTPRPTKVGKGIFMGGGAMEKRRWEEPAFRWHKKKDQEIKKLTGRPKKHFQVGVKYRL